VTVREQGRNVGRKIGGKLIKKGEEKVIKGVSL
jgi:hypothetical protein